MVARLASGLAKPNRIASLLTWVSTGKAGILKPSAKTTLAVLGPTPAKDSKSSLV